MSKQLKDEWREKLSEKYHLGNDSLTEEVADFFYSLHLDHIKTIREKIATLKKDFTNHICRFNDTPQKCECYEKALDDVLLTIAE